MWSDESKYNIFNSDGRTYVRRRIGEEFQDECVKGTVKHGGGSVMVWGCMCVDKVGMMTQVRGRMNSKDYLDILEDVMIP